jgi:3-oxoacyl-[acyl-carrier-protein] synthase-3
MTQAMPDYIDVARRIYTHQASPSLVAHFAQSGIYPSSKTPSNARQLGNLISSATATMCYADYLNGEIQNGDIACFSVVGAGPERGAFLIPIDIAGTVNATEPTIPLSEYH